MSKNDCKTHLEFFEHKESWEVCLEESLKNLSDNLLLLPFASSKMFMNHDLWLASQEWRKQKIQWWWQRFEISWRYSSLLCKRGCTTSVCTAKLADPPASGGPLVTSELHLLFSSRIPEGIPWMQVFLKLQRQQVCEVCNQVKRLDDFGRRRLSLHQMESMTQKEQTIIILEWRSSRNKHLAHTKRRSFLKEVSSSTFLPSFEYKISFFKNLKLTPEEEASSSN